MPKVGLPAGLADEFTGGKTEIEVEGKNVRSVVKSLDAKYPGIGQAIDQEMAIAIDGHIYQDGFLQKIDEDSEVFFLPKIAGGAPG